MDFQFHPWERLSLDVTDGEAIARAEVDGSVWLFRQCGLFVFARVEESAKSEWNFLVRSFFYAPRDEEGKLNWEQLNVSASNLADWTCAANRVHNLERVWKVEEAFIVCRDGGCVVGVLTNRARIDGR